MLESAPTTFGELLRRHRQAAGLTQQELAERAGLSVHGIQKLERGVTHPYRDTVRGLVAALNLEADDQARVRALVAPVRGHGATAPTSSVSDEPRHNLPLPVTSLIGREAATREVTELLTGTLLLTLTGVG